MFTYELTHSVQSSIKICYPVVNIRLSFSLPYRERLYYFGQWYIEYYRCVNISLYRFTKLLKIGLKVNSLQFDLHLPSNSVSKVVEIHPYSGGGKKRIENLQPADLFRA